MTNVGFCFFFGYNFVCALNNDIKRGRGIRVHRTVCMTTGTKIYATSKFSAVERCLKGKEMESGDLLVFRHLS